jgi:hypothetical protein
MPDLKYLYRAVYILINCSFKQIVDIVFNKAYYQESYILIIEYSSQSLHRVVGPYTLPILCQRLKSSLPLY